MSSTDLITQDAMTLDIAIRAWLVEKHRSSESLKTARAYQDTLQRFRAALNGVGLDLDGANEHAITLAAQGWAGQPWDATRRRTVSGSTYNQRLAILSSFYTFARARGVTRSDPITGQRVPIGNPVAVIQRARVHDYAHAQALSAEAVAAQIEAIDRSTATGQRDYALLGIALTTGRRLAELAAMNTSDLDVARGVVTVTFPRAKGGKVMRDALPAVIGDALLAYLGSRRDATEQGVPVWLSHSTFHNGERLSEQGIADVWARRLGTSKVHATRHTFAHAMEQAGAKVSEIQARLGHASLQTTGRYLQALSTAENKHASGIAASFGFHGGHGNEPA